MNYDIYIYISSVLASLSGWFVVWRKNRDASWFFFFLFTIFASIWFFTFSFFPTTFFPDEIQLLVSRLLFCSSTLALYSLFCFLLFFWENITYIWSKKILIPIIVFLSIWIVYMGTDLIIERLEYNLNTDTYHQVKGSLFALHISSHFIGIFLFFDTLFRKIKTQNSLGNIKLKNILFSTLIVSFTLFILKMALPIFQLWIGEKEMVFLCFVFVGIVLIVIRRNYFFRIWDKLWQFFLFIVSGIGAFLLIKTIKYFFHIIQSGLFDVWMSQSVYFLLDIFGIITFYSIFYWTFRSLFHGNHLLTDLFTSIENLKKSVSNATDIASLNDIISQEMNKTFKPHSSSIRLYNPGEDVFVELRKYFDDNNRGRFFINDDLFIEQNKRFYDTEKLRWEIPKDAFLIFPFYDALWKNIGIFILWSKKFWDAYTKTELDVLGSFSHFLETHLRYMWMHVTAKSLSLNMDEKINEKLTEYNSLINRQKEFIWVISHEIRSPLSAAIFQSGSIVEDIGGTRRVSRQKLKNEIAILNTQLVRTGGLLSKLFSVQYHDTHEVELVREAVIFGDFIAEEIDFFRHVYSHVVFHTSIDEEIGIVFIDRVQFQQVISNLLENAVKFLSGQDSPLIRIRAQKIDTDLRVVIEDNGRGFEWINTEDIFDKYSTGRTGSIWLWMWLYLSKKIVTLHHGTIIATLSEKYGGAKFVIKIPVE